MATAIGCTPAVPSPSDGAAIATARTRPGSDAGAKSAGSGCRAAQPRSSASARRADRTGRCSTSLRLGWAIGLAVPPAHAAPAAPAAPAARGALPSLAHGEGAAPERLAVEGVDRRLRLGVRRHLDEGEAPGAAGLAIGHDLDLLDLTPVLLEEGPKLVLIHLVREVPNV